MESQNVAVVRRAYELFSRLDADPEKRRGSPTVAELMELFTDDVEMISSRAAPDADCYRGRRQFEAAWVDWLQAWREHCSTIEEIRESGDRVLVLSHERFTGREGVRVGFHGAGIFTVRDGRIARFEGYTEQQPAIDAFERS